MSLVEMALDKLRAAQSKTEAKTANTPRVGSLAPQVVPPEPTREDSGKLVNVDREALRAAGFLPESAFERRMADQYRQVKRPLISHAHEHPEVPNARFIAVASSLPGDGKTFTSINLALSLAREREARVLLVDCDVAKPHVSRLFGVDNEPGLLDALADPLVHPESLVISTDIRGLSLLPAGQPRDGAAELLSSNRLAEIGNLLLARDPKRLVVFDSSPLLVTTESRSLIDLVGQVVLVVRAGVTPRQAVAEAAAMIGTDKKVGIVLNQSQSAPTNNYYVYGDYGSASIPAE